MTVLGYRYVALLLWRVRRNVNMLRDDQEGKFDAADFPSWTPPYDFDPAAETRDD